MRARLYFQDPTDPATEYLSEVLIEQIRDPDAVALEIVVAFATADGLNAVVEDPDFAAFAERGEVRVVVGVDAITLPEALDVLSEAQDNFPHFEAEVFDNPTRRLFHPKLARIRRGDGSTTVVIGSGNATTGGLQGNFEAFVVLELDAGEEVTAEALDEFLDRHANDLRDLDARSYALAAANRRLIRRRQEVLEVEPAEEEDGEAADEDEAIADDIEADEEPAALALEDPVLVAQVPHAGGRWGQVGLNEAVVEDFFGTVPNSSQRVRLRLVLASGDIGGTEIRPITMSGINRNRRLEIGAARGYAYPRTGAPILVFRQRGIRQYDYMLVFPGEDGHDGLRQILRMYPTVGRGDPRVVITCDELEADWPDSPLLTVD